MAAQDVILLLLPVQLHDDREHIQAMPAPTVQRVLALCPSSSSMAAQDVILLLLPVQLDDDREQKQGILAPTAPTSPRPLS
jgi:hypothetical protein